jgi:TatA/E family protein of Tat protein translocase
MFGMGMPEILLILAVALIVIGPKKLPGLAKSLGRAMGEFKNATQDLKRSIDLEDDLRDVKNSMNNLKDIPTYDPDQSAYTGADTDRPTDDAGDETPKNSARAETADAVKPPDDAVADEPAAPGAKSHG